MISYGDLSEVSKKVSPVVKTQNLKTLTDLKLQDQDYKLQDEDFYKSQSYTDFYHLLQNCQVRQSSI